MRTVLFGTVAALALVTGAQAQAPAPPAMTLDFLAHGKDGRTPADLSAAEVELKIDGKTRPLVSLEHVPAAERGRRILILLDEATLYTFEPMVRESVAKLIASLAPADQISLVTTRRSKAGVVRGADVVKQALESMVTGPGIFYTCLAETMRNIESMAKTMPAGRGSTVVLLSRGHPVGAEYGSEGDAAPCTPRREAMRQAADALAARQVNVMLFTVDDNTRSWGLDTLAGNIGATSELITWSNTETLHRAVARTQQFYRATFATDPASPERPQRVSLKVKRKDVRTTTSPTLVIRPSSAGTQHP